MMCMPHLLRSLKSGRFVLVAAVLGLVSTPAFSQPRRVVSLNVCTDQLAMLVAEPGQLLSVSHLAADPAVSALAEAARAYRLNYGSAEEVFMMKPDLVLAGSYTTRSTVNLLRGLGVTVEEFPPASSLDDIPRDIRRMGQVLQRETQAEALAGKFEAELAALEALPPTGMSAAFYYANSYTAGGGTLVDAIVAAAGMTNAAQWIGLSGTAYLPLESLILAGPDVVVLGDHAYEKPALAQANFAHPALADFINSRRSVSVPPRMTICGGPVTLEAARILRAVAEGDKGT